MDATALSDAMRVLILTIEDDPHVNAVAWALRQVGVHPEVWYWKDFPSFYQMGLTISSAASLPHEINIGASRQPFDLVWTRRIGTSSAGPAIHPDDAAIVVSESDRFLQYVLPTIVGSKGRWINKPHAYQQAKNKVLQLQAAKIAGFRIPQTYMGNHPQGLAAFSSALQSRLIYKPYGKGGWIGEDGAGRVLRTALLNQQQITDQSMIAACPGIYQEFIDKRREFRITVLGKRLVAAEICLPATETVDWRYDIEADQLRLQPATLPAQVVQQCIDVCAQLDIEFGCIDLIEATDGSYVFLEVNSGGQFLWKEARNPSIPMLRSFCEFMLDRCIADDVDLSWAAYRRSLPTARATAA